MAVPSVIGMAEAAYNIYGLFQIQDCLALRILLIYSLFVALLNIVGQA